MNYSYSYSNGYDSYSSSSDVAALGGALAGVMVAFWIFAMIVSVVAIIAQWKIFTKAGEAGWKSIVPIYNYITLMKITGLNPLFLLGMLIPVVNGIASLIIMIAIMLRLAQGFGKSTGFAVGLILLSFIFMLILAFGKDTWNPSLINRDTLSFMNDKNAAPAGPAAAAPVAQPQQPQDPWANGQPQA